MQKIFLNYYKTSVKDNIKLANTEASDEEIEDFAKRQMELYDKF